jgi:flagellar hook-associated protein 1 FlgK
VSNLLSTLLISAGALEAYSQSLDVVQNNVTNANTPGYAAQTQSLVPEAFDPSVGLQGGVQAGQVISSRNEYAEQTVRQQKTMLGTATQNVSSLTSLQTVFNISGNTGIPFALNNLLSSFSAWAQSSTDTTTQQSVLNNASDLASAFQQTASSLDAVRQTTESQIGDTVDQINQLAAQLAQYNGQILKGDSSDAGLDAQIHSTLDQLAQYVNFTASKQADGSYTVLINGQVPLVMENQQYQISSQMAQPTNPPPTNLTANPPPPLAEIQSSDGTDITAQITGGQLGSLLNFRNTVLPTYIGDAYQAGSLNTMAQHFADTVNQALTLGEISSGPPAVNGIPLFTYDTTTDTNEAASLAVNPDITAGQLAAISTTGTAPVSNGVPLALAQLATPQSDADEINGESYSQYYGDMATEVGNQLQDATNEQQVQQSAVAQAQNLLQQYSGVNLDEEAVTLVQFQRAYEANSQMVNVLDTLTADTINMLSSASA